MDQKEQDHLEEEIRALLHALGDSPEAVANSLDNEGCRGWRAGGRNCPLWRLLEREYGEQNLTFIVDVEFIEVYREDESADVGSPGKYLFTIDDVPHVISDFIRMFDKDKKFSFLIPEKRAR